MSAENTAMMKGCSEHSVYFVGNAENREKGEKRKRKERKRTWSHQWKGSQIHPSAFSGAGCELGNDCKEKWRDLSHLHKAEAQTTLNIQTLCRTRLALPVTLTNNSPHPSPPPAHLVRARTAVRISQNATQTEGNEVISLPEQSLLSPRAFPAV